MVLDKEISIFKKEFLGYACFLIDDLFKVEIIPMYSTGDTNINSPVKFRVAVCLTDNALDQCDEPPKYDTIEEDILVYSTQYSGFTGTLAGIKFKIDLMLTIYPLDSNIKLRQVLFEFKAATKKSRTKDK